MSANYSEECSRDHYAAHSDASSYSNPDMMSMYSRATPTDELLANFYSKFRSHKLPIWSFDWLIPILRNDSPVSSLKFFSRGFPNGFGDALIDLLRHSSFNREELTMRFTVDILDRIYDKERTTVDTREAKYRSRLNGKRPTGTIPQVVVELVAEVLDSLRDPFPLDDRSCSEDTLNRMSRVHPSWTCIAQRKLRRVYRLNRISLDPYLSLQNPHIGPWVQQLALDLVRYRDDNMCRILNGFVRRCPNLTHLDVRGVIFSSSTESPDTPPPPGEVHSAIRLIGHLTSLEYLRLCSVVAFYPYSLWDLCQSVRLPFLRKLELHGWIEHEAFEGEEPVAGGGRNQDDPDLAERLPKLDALILDDVRVRDYQSLISLMRPHDVDYALKLDLICRDLNPMFLSYLRPAMYRVSRLQVEGARLVAFADLLRETNNVRTFTIIPWLPSNFLGGGFALPRSVRLFHLHIDDHWFRRIDESVRADPLVHIDEIGRQVLGVLEPSPWIRDMLVTVSPTERDGLVEYAKENACFPKVREYCEARNTTFRISVEEPPDTQRPCYD